jgi:hypothetical protein
VSKITYTAKEVLFTNEGNKNSELVIWGWVMTDKTKLFVNQEGGIKGIIDKIIVGKPSLSTC